MKIIKSGCVQLHVENMVLHAVCDNTEILCCNSVDQKSVRQNWVVHLLYKILILNLSFPLFCGVSQVVAQTNS